MSAIEDAVKKLIQIDKEITVLELESTGIGRNY